MFVTDVLQVRSPGKWRGIANTEFWACSIPHSVQNCVGAMERLLCDGHNGYEEGERCHCCLSRYLSVITGSWTDVCLTETTRVYVPVALNAILKLSSFDFFLFFSTDWSRSCWICYWHNDLITTWSRVTFLFFSWRIRYQTDTDWLSEWLMDSLFQWIDASVNEKTNWHTLCLAVSGGEWHS